MREIDHAHDAENQREADSQQRIGAAENDRIQEVLKKLIQIVMLRGIERENTGSS
ncbi:MAG TPA: hypothetical protein VFB45_17010 [Pseudolabrys sp.]|nr:hypothetical protein [Pseudolabrys sp.]